MSAISGEHNKTVQLSVNSFLPGGNWTPYTKGEVFSDSKTPAWIKDEKSGAFYLNQPTDCLRFKLFFLTGILAGGIGNGVSLTINGFYRTVKVLSLSHFISPIFSSGENQADKPYQIKERVIACAKDVLRIVATPFALIALLFVSFAVSLSPFENGPRDAAKIFSSIEIAMYGGTMEEGYFGWAPCYQPNSTFHRFGGDINNERAY